MRILLAGFLLISACGTRSASHWPLKRFAVLRFSGRHANGALSVAAVPGGSHVLSSGGDDTVRIWDSATGQESKRFSGSMYRFQNIALAPSGTYALTPAPGAAVRYWTVASGLDIRRFMGAQASPLTVALSPDGTLAAAAGGGAIHVWELATGNPVRELPVKSQVIRIAFAAAGDGLVSAESDGRLCRWPEGDGADPDCFSVGADPMAQAAFTADGKVALVGTRFGSLELWNVPLKVSMGKLDGALGDIASMALSPDGAWALFGGADKVVRLWDMNARQEVAHAAASGSYVSCVAFSADATMGVFGTDNGEIALWRLR